MIDFYALLLSLCEHRHEAISQGRPIPPLVVDVETFDEIDAAVRASLTLYPTVRDGLPMRLNGVHIVVGAL